MSLLDLLFPKYCVGCRKLGSYLCDKCFTSISFLDHDVCVACQSPAIGGLTHPRCQRRYEIDGVFASLVYKGVVKRLVYQFKYKPHITQLKPLLVDLLCEGLIQKETCSALLQKETVFIPIPLHPTKRKKRGYNQAKLLAEGLAGRLGMRSIDCLIRTKQTGTQVDLSQEERYANIADAFALKETDVSTIKQAFLVDDVATSGATLREAAKVLKKVGVEKVYGVTLAHGQ